MSSTIYPFRFEIPNVEDLSGELVLEKSPDELKTRGSTCVYREGMVSLADSRFVRLVLCHSSATAEFIYLRSTLLDPDALRLLGLSTDVYAAPQRATLPGLLTVGTARTRLVAQGVGDLVSNPVFGETVTKCGPAQMIVVPVLREGAKFQIAEAIYGHYGFNCDEIVADAHHKVDKNVPGYGRRVEFTCFKDSDLTEVQRDQVSVVVVGDSIASGVVLIEMLDVIQTRFRNATNIEIIAPYAALRGIARLAANCPPGLAIRVHVFETVLNALPPDYYYSAHFEDEFFHIRPELERQYREWWGFNRNGGAIADTACAGFGWSEAYFCPRKHIGMLNQQLESRHRMSLEDIVGAHLDKVLPLDS